MEYVCNALFSHFVMFRERFFCVHIARFQIVIISPLYVRYEYMTIFMRPYHFNNFFSTYVSTYLLQMYTDTFATSVTLLFRIRSDQRKCC